MTFWAGVIMLSSSRAEFALRDPSALSALLSYDWRARHFLTDAELLGEAGHKPAVQGDAASLIRPMQRQGFIRPLHGVRPHGGRMRLWHLRDVLKIQIVSDLRSISDLSVNACLRHLASEGPELVETALDGWQDHAGAPGEGCAVAQMRLEGLPKLPKDAALAELVTCSIARFVHRNRFDTVERPAFLA